MNTKVNQRKDLRQPDVIFGMIIKNIRERAGLSQDVLASKSGLHRTYVSQIERGLKTPTIITLLRFSAALGVQPDKLIRELEENLRSAGFDLKQLEKPPQ